MMEDKGWRLEWKGAECQARAIRTLVGGLGEFDLEVERVAKSILQPEHGVVTGTLRRSIHAAHPAYRWEGDDVIPTRSTPERGGRGGGPEEVGGIIAGTIGSGLSYALPVHDGRGSFPGYHYITTAFDRVEHKLPEILGKHAGLQGLK